MDPRRSPRKRISVIVGSIPTGAHFSMKAQHDMNGESLSKEIAAKIYDILVAEAGASLEWKAKEHFTDLQSSEYVTEFRFCGKLGLGGKFWRNGGRWYINCYPDDSTPERERIIKATNERLQALMIQTTQET